MSIFLPLSADELRACGACRFCGSTDAQIYETYTHGDAGVSKWSVGCNGCGASGPLKNDRDSAIMFWGVYDADSWPPGEPLTQDQAEQLLAAARKHGHAAAKFIERLAVELLTRDYGGADK